MIELQNVSAGYLGKDVIRHIDLRLADGEITSIVGKNGCGKTTLLKVIARQLKASAGTILLDNKDLYRYDSRELARKIAILPQVRTLAPISVQTLALHGRFPHLSFPRNPSARDRDIAAQAMQDAGIWDLRQKLISELSGGERQKAYLAMALAQDTGIILLDEPTTFLDINHQMEFYQLVGKLKEMGKTIVMVVHDLPAALNHSNRICLMDNGGIVLHDQTGAVFASREIDRVFGICCACIRKPDNKLNYYLDM